MSEGQYTHSEAMAEAERIQDKVPNNGKASGEDYRQAEREVERENATEKMASQLHEEWRATRKQKDGSFEPRVKKTTDQAWISKTGAVVKTDESGKNYAEIDIANTPYEGLPDEWKAENLASAEVSVGLVAKAIDEGRALDDSFIEEASAVIHDEWLKRNGEWAPEEQKLPYAQLSEEEKEKDRTIARQAINIMQ